MPACSHGGYSQPSLKSQGSGNPGPSPLSCCVISRIELGLSELLFPPHRGYSADEMGSQEASVCFLPCSHAHTSIYTLPEGCEEAEMRLEPWSAGSQILGWVASSQQMHILLHCLPTGPWSPLEYLTPWWRPRSSLT